jgi:hypothetical protein
MRMDVPPAGVTGENRLRRGALWDKVELETIAPS